MLCAFCHFELVKSDDGTTSCQNPQCPFRGRPQEDRYDASTGEADVVADTDENPTKPPSSGD